VSDWEREIHLRILLDHFINLSQSPEINSSAYLGCADFSLGFCFVLRFWIRTCVFMLYGCYLGYPSWLCILASGFLSLGRHSLPLFLPHGTVLYSVGFLLPLMSSLPRNETGFGLSGKAFDICFYSLRFWLLGLVF